MTAPARTTVRQPTICALVAGLGVISAMLLAMRPAGAAPVSQLRLAPTTIAESGTFQISLNYAGDDSSSCPSNAATTTKDVGTVTELCALVTEDDGTPVQGTPVLFATGGATVSGSAAGAAANSGAGRYQGTTDADGVATAYTESKMLGEYGVDATALGRTSNGVGITYQQRPGTRPATVTLVAQRAYLVQGDTDYFLATVTDDAGNAFENADVTFTHTGPGTMIGDPRAGTGDTTDDVIDGTTNYAGQASVGLVVPPGATTGSQGTITVSAPTPDSPSNQTSTSTSTYTVNTPAAVTAYGANGAKVGAPTFASSLATDSRGIRVQGAVLHFTIVGSSTITGTATTDEQGRAKFVYTPLHAGPVRIHVTDDQTPSHAAATTSFTKKGDPTTQLTQVSPQRYRIRDTAAISIKQPGIRVDFYQQHVDGRYVFVGSADTDADGVAQYIHYRLKTGYRYTALAKVSGGNADFDGPDSKAETTTVS